jgi:hypothetical protein
MAGMEVLLHVCLTLCKHDSTGFGFGLLSQLSKFAQYPGVIHLEAAERVLQLAPTYEQALHTAIQDLFIDFKESLAVFCFGTRRETSTQILDESAVD